MARAKKVYQPIGLPEKIFRECDVMLKHATSKGLSVPPALVRDYMSIYNRTEDLGKLRLRHSMFFSYQNIQFSELDLTKLSNIHTELARIVAPATPFTLLFVQTDSVGYGRFQVFGSVPLIRRMLFMTILCLLILVSFAFLPNGRALIENALLDNKHLDLVLAVLFRLAAAGMGASFFALYKAKKYVANNTFDPSYEATYWTEFILGLMAGLIFSTFLDNQDVGSSFGATLMMGKIAVALLGGFSSTVVYEFLNKTVNALASIFKPDVSAVLETEIKSVKADIENSFAQKKQTVLNHLADLQSDIFSGKFSKDDIGGRVKNMMDDLIDGDNQGYTPQVKPVHPNIPTNIPTSGDIDINIEDIEPMSVAAIHPDDINEASEDEYVSIFDTRA